MADQDETKAPGTMGIEDDVEGHSFKTLKIDDEDDVEGHSFKTLKIDDEDDVEGHSFGTFKSPTSRGE